MKEKKKTAQRIINTNELPRVSFVKTRHLGGVETERELYEATGFTVKEARENFEWLFKNHRGE